jgi:hypothetical protein
VFIPFSTLMLCCVALSSNVIGGPPFLDVRSPPRRWGLGPRRRRAAFWHREASVGGESADYRTIFTRSLTAPSRSGPRSRIDRQKAASVLAPWDPGRCEMATCLTLRRPSVFTLVATLILAHTPEPAYASGEEAAVRPAPRGVLTLGGRPLSQLTTAVPGATLPGWLERARVSTGQNRAAGGTAVSHSSATRPARQPTTGSADPLWKGIVIGATV